jgi:hypothetical protein
VLPRLRPRHGTFSAIALGSVIAACAPQGPPARRTAAEVRVPSLSWDQTPTGLFGAYVASMHRRIHKLWGFGIVEDWDQKPPSSPFNDPSLWAMVEVVLNGDGTVDKVALLRSSGYLPYDAADIHSANGKVYIHWRFFRDTRQCSTAGVDFFILNPMPPNGGDPPVPGLSSEDRLKGERFAQRVRDMRKELENTRRRRPLSPPYDGGSPPDGPPATPQDLR